MTPHTHYQAARAAASARLVFSVDRPTMVVNPASPPRLFDTVKANFPHHRGRIDGTSSPCSSLLAPGSSIPHSLQSRHVTKLPLAIRSYHDLRAVKLRPIWTNVNIQPEYQTPEQRRVLNRFLHEFIMKQLVTISVPKAAVVLFSLIRGEVSVMRIWGLPSTSASNWDPPPTRKTVIMEYRFPRAPSELQKDAPFGLTRFIPSSSQDG